MNRHTHESAHRGRLDTYEASSRTVIVIHPDPLYRDVLARGLPPTFRPVDFPDVDAAIGRTTKPPVAVLLGDQAEAKAGTSNVARLRGQPAFAAAPIVLCATGTRSNRPKAGGDQPDAVVDFPVRDRELIDLLSGLVDTRVEASWDKLPSAPREALRRTLKMFTNFAELVGSGSALDYQHVEQACAPVLDAVKSAGHRYVFDGLKNHNGIHYVHSMRVATLLALFGFTIGLEEELLMTLAAAGLVHDIGKTVLPETIVRKAGPLDETEWKVARTHVDQSVEYLSQNSNVPKGVLTIAAQHHERLDGSGYPHGLANGQLNDLARMSAIVDVFAALTERRPYRAAMSPFQALEVMEETLREKLDQKLTKLFRNMLLDAA